MKWGGIEHSRTQGLRSRRKSSGNLPSGEIKRKERLITKINFYNNNLITKIIKIMYCFITNSYTLAYQVVISILYHRINKTVY